MEYVNLGNTGLRVSRVCLGMMSYGKHESRPWALDEAAAEPIVRRAVEGGINFFDTADVYYGGASEDVTGRACSGCSACARSMWWRPRSTAGRAGRERPRALAQARLGLDRRVAAAAGHRLRRPLPDPPLGSAHADRGDDGGAARRRPARGRRATSARRSMYAWQFAKATAPIAGWTRFVSMQNHYNLVYREEEREMIPLCLDQGVGVVPWSPLGARVTRRQPHARPANGDRARERATHSLDTLYAPRSTSPSSTASAEVAAERGVQPAQIALAWLLHKPGVTAPIVGRDEGRTPRGRARRRAAVAEQRGDRTARGTVRPPRGLRNRSLGACQHGPTVANVPSWRSPFDHQATLTRR